MQIYHSLARMCRLESLISSSGYAYIKPYVDFVLNGNYFEITKIGTKLPVQNTVI